MPNGGAGAGKRADYSDVADRQTRRRPGSSPLDGPALSHPGSRRRFSCATPGPLPRQRAYGVSRPVRAYGQASCQRRCRQNKGMVAFSTDSGVIFIDAVAAEKWGKRKKKVQRRREFRMVIPGAANGPGVGRGSFCRLLPAYGQEQAVYFVRLAPPRTRITQYVR